ncbi:hypothetical protein PMIN03_009053 [Paraphaeosphaeria minitans]
MHDLRRQALESGKTVSRKARSRVASGANSKSNSALNSPAQSRAASRNPSRHGSDDDDDYLSDGTAWSTNSIDDILNSEDADVPTDAWKAELHNRVEQIVDRKRSSTEGRAESLNAYAHILMARFAKDDIEGRIGELLPSILRSIKSETSERETVTALRALAVTIVTLDSDELYDSASDLLRRKVSDSESTQVKIGAIHALGTAAFFGGTSEDDLEDTMAFFLEIVESDGLSVDAHDEGSVVIAALEEWSLLVTALDDLEAATETAMEALVEQLESADAGVQGATGEAIALLYEKSYTPIEDDEVPESASDDEELPRGTQGNLYVKRYTVYRRQDQLLHTLDALANASSRRISKKDRKTLHSTFADIRNTVEKPTRGPKYSTAIDQETGFVYGGRMKVKINRNCEVRIDKWWKLQRLNALRRVLQSGFTLHYDENEAVSRCLPFSMSGR